MNLEQFLLLVGAAGIIAFIVSVVYIKKQESE
jgi:hypothetical protein